MTRRRPHYACIALCVLAAGCATFRASPATSSHVDGGQFVNDFLRLHIAIPGGWHALPRAEVDRVQDRVRAASKNPDAAARVAFLLAMARIDAHGPAASPVILVVAEKLVLPDLSADEYANTQVRAGAECTQQGVREPVVLGAVDGTTYRRRCAKHEERMVAAVARGYGVVVLGMWHAEDQRADVESVLGSVRFVR